MLANIFLNHRCYEMIFNELTIDNRQSDQIERFWFDPSAVEPTYHSNIYFIS